MRITLSLPDRLARRFLAAVPVRQRSALVARLIETELNREVPRSCLPGRESRRSSSERNEGVATLGRFGPDMSHHYQVRAIAKHRLRERIEGASPADVSSVVAGLAKVLEIP